MRQNHISITPQRQAILEYVIKHNYPSVNQIYVALKKEIISLSPSTVYDTLRALLRTKIVSKVHDGNNKVRFDFRGKPHWTAICQKCGRIYKVYDQEYSKINHHLGYLVTRRGFQYSDIHIEIYGICPICRAKLKRTNN